MSNISNYKTGLFAEFVARMYLRLHGFKILKSRYITGRHTNRAEIDIIARRGELIIFVEVKKRKSIDVAFGAITPNQAQRLRRAAETFIAQKHWNGDARFDVITVCHGNINWIRGAL